MIIVVFDAGLDLNNNPTISAAIPMSKSMQPNIHKYGHDGQQRK